jgi:hypothetical protein
MYKGQNVLWNVSVLLSIILQIDTSEIPYVDSK